MLDKLKNNLVITKQKCLNFKILFIYLILCLKFQWHNLKLICLVCKHTQVVNSFIYSEISKQHSRKNTQNQNVSFQFFYNKKYQNRIDNLVRVWQPQNSSLKYFEIKIYHSK